MSTPTDLRYSASHEWVRVEADGTLTIGITDHAQEALGDVVFLELPEAGRVVAAEEALAVIESVKAASDIYAPSPARSSPSTRRPWTPPSPSMPTPTPPGSSR